MRYTLSNYSDVDITGFSKYLDQLPEYRTRSPQSFFTDSDRMILDPACWQENGDQIPNYVHLRHIIANAREADPGDQLQLDAGRNWLLAFSAVKFSRTIMKILGDFLTSFGDMKHAISHLVNSCASIAHSYQKLRNFSQPILETAKKVIENSREIIKNCRARHAALKADTTASSIVEIDRGVFVTCLTPFARH